MNMNSKDILTEYGTAKRISYDRLGGDLGIELEYPCRMVQHENPSDLWITYFDNVYKPNESYVDEPFISVDTDGDCFILIGKSDQGFLCVCMDENQEQITIDEYGTVHSNVVGVSPLIIWDNFIFPRLMNYAGIITIIQDEFILPIMPTAGVFVKVRSELLDNTGLAKFYTQRDGYVEDLFHTALLESVTLSELRTAWLDWIKGFPVDTSSLGAAAALDGLDMSKTALNMDFDPKNIAALDRITTRLYEQSAAEYLLASTAEDAPDLGWNGR